MKMTQRLLAVLLALAMTAPMAACGNDTDSEKEVNGKNTVDKVQATYVTSPLNVPSIIEKEKGLLTKSFAEEEIEFGYSNLTTGPEQTQALASGDIQFLNAVGRHLSFYLHRMGRISKS